MYYLSVLASLKNETMNLKMWIEHYLWQGVEHFYLIDNGSDDDPLSILQEYIDKRIVTYYFLPEKHRQVHNYRYVFDNANLKNETFWLAVCDLDEFFFGVDKNLKINLRTLEYSYDYIICYWKLFGSDGHINHPEDIRRDITFRKKDLGDVGKYIFKPQIIDNSSRIWIHTLVDIDVERKTVENVLIQFNHWNFFKKLK
jgi:glycosyltransferase involved in cell wall biosynthesis